MAEPHSEDTDLRLHLASCHDCTHFAERIQRFESRLERALSVGVDAQMKDPRVVTPLRPARRRTPAQAGMARAWNPPYRRWVAAAASVLLGTVVAVSLWLAAPGRSLAADVVLHMAEEPYAWARTNVPVSEPKLDEVLTESHVRLRPNVGLVSYANSCGFRGHKVPHLVVQTEAGPVTVMVLVHEALRSRVRFNELGYRGVIVPVHAHGSLAVLERGSSMDIKEVEDIAARVLSAIDWTT